MKFLRPAVFSLCLLPLAPAISLAGMIGQACLDAGRAPDSSLCSCIQKVADMTLSGADQRRASGFFHDPDQAQEVRQSDRASDEDFWLRYKEFADAAQGYCTK